MTQNLAKIILLTFMLALIGGCASNDKQYKSKARREYEAAKAQMAKSKYAEVAMSLEKFSSNYPYSKYAVQAELLRIFAAYKDSEYVLSETLSKQFIDRHPKHANVDYAKYMHAMSFYQQRSPAEKDATMNQLAIDAFKRLLKEHPNSAYAKDGKSHLQALYNTLAKHELTVGKFYYDKDRFIAAANRFQEVVRLYQTTPAIEESLYYLAASYDRMGMKKDAREIAVLLRHNYPNSAWSSKAKRYL